MNPLSEKLLDKLIASIDSWRSDLKIARDDYNSSIKILDTARITFENEKKSLWEKGLPYAPFITAIIFALIIAIAFKCGTLNLGNYSYSKPCTELPVAAKHAK